MANRQRKVSFYQIHLERHINLRDANTVQIHQLSNANTKEYFNIIYNDQMRALANGSKAIDVDTLHATYVVEVISFAGNRAFIKIGQQNAANTVGIRDMQTLELNDVPMTENQLLELFTYCLIDFETGVISYIGINGAPKISAIRSLFDKFLRSENVYAKLASIMTRDVLQILMRKNIISKIFVDVAVPSDEVLAEDIGLNAAAFDSLRNVRTRNVSYKLIANRNRNILQDSNQIATLIENIKSKFGDNLRSINVKARDYGETPQLYDILQDNFTKTVVLGGTDNHNTIREDDFANALETTYNTHKPEILRYIS